jgi:hypothetical protein
VECVLRAVSGEAYGIGDDLHYGEAKLSRGRIYFVPRGDAAGGVAIEVTSVDTSRDLRSEDSEPWRHTSRYLVVCQLSTPQGLMEWGVHYKLVYAAAKRLNLPQA